MIVARIIAPHFVAGIKLNDDFPPYVIDAAPIVRYMMGWTPIKIENYCRNKGWKVRQIR